MAGFFQRATHRIMADYRRVSTRQLREPSFTYKRHEASRVRKLMRQLGCKDPSFLVDAKDDAHTWVRRLGIRVPEMLGIYADIGDVPWEELPDRVVIKPLRGTTSAGVYLLERRVSQWVERRTGHTMDHARSRAGFARRRDAARSRRRCSSRS